MWSAPVVVDCQAQGVQPAQAGDEATIREMFAQYYAAYQSRHIERTMSFWDPEAGEFQALQKRFAAFFPLQRYEFSNLQVSRIQQDGDQATVRVAIDAVVVTQGTNTRPERQRWILAVALRRQDGAWRVWRETSLIETLVRRLRRLDTLEARLALLAQDPDLVTPDLARELERDAMVMGLKPDQALEWSRLMEHVARQAKSDEFIGAALIRRARVFEATGETDLARDLYAQAIAGFEAAGLPHRVGDAETTVATSYLRRLDYANAQRHYRAAVSAFERAGDRAWLASALHSLGTTYYFEGDWDEALAQYRRSLAVQEEQVAAEGADVTTARRRGVAAAHQSIAMVHQERGDYDEAVASYTEGLRRFKELDDRAGATVVHIDLARLRRRQENPDLALRHYLDGLDAAFQVDGAYRDMARIATITREVAEVLARERRYATALEYYQRSLATSEEAQHKAGVAAALAGMGAVHYLQGRHDAALGFYLKSLAIREVDGDRPAVAWTLLNVGLVQASLGKHAESLSAYSRSLDMAVALKNRAWEAILLALIAGSHLAHRAPDRALEFARRGQVLAAEIENPDVLERAHLVAGAAHLAADRPGDAAIEIEAAIQALDRWRAERKIGQHDDFFADPAGPYLAKARLAFEQRRVADAFAAAERLRIRRLRDTVSSDVSRGLTVEERDEERRLARAFVSLGRQLLRQRRQPRADKTRTASLEQEFRLLASARDAFEAALSARHPELRALKANVEPLPFDAVPGLIPDTRTAILEFLVTDEKTYLFLFAKERTGQRQAPSAPAATRPVAEAVTIETTAADLARRVTRFRELLSRPDSKPEKAARELYELLLRPVEPWLHGRTRLVVLPDAALWALPFQALQPASGRYLIHEHSVEYAVSLTALATLRSLAGPAPVQASAGRRAAVSFGNPDAELTATRRLLLDRPEPRSRPDPEADREARAVAALFGSGGRAFTGREATRDAALRTRARFVHCATAGRLSDTSPMRSQLYFAPGGTLADVSGIVEARELIDWDPEAEVVVFSRLESDPSTTGEGLTALSWALFAAGVRSAILSAWAVDAPAAGILSVELYGRLRQAAPGSAGAGAAGALRQGMLRLLQAPLYRHPHYWAHLNVFSQTIGR